MIHIGKTLLFYPDEQYHISIAITAHSFVKKQWKSSINNYSWGIIIYSIGKKLFFYFDKII